ncbi:hypothetical protein MAJ_07749, partial [Metarhizium majus ARSEF 297]
MNFIASFFPAAPDARILAATVQSKALADMLANDASKVAQVYPWVADLRASQIPDAEIVKAMIETENVTWMEGALNLEAENYVWRETPERKETPRHLDHLEHGCVHPPRLIESSQRIPSDLHEPESSWLEKTVDAFAVFAQREQVALKHCGIGGVLHPGVLIGNSRSADWQQSRVGQLPRRWRLCRLRRRDQRHGQDMDPSLGTPGELEHNTIQDCTPMAWRAG